MKNERQKRYRLRAPWVRFVEWARRRCSDPAERVFKHYGAKGITCTLDAAQAKALWFRDNAAALKKPSLDRIDPKLGYSFENCRFIEFNLNARLAWDKDAQAEPQKEVVPEFT